MAIVPLGSLEAEPLKVTVVVILTGFGLTVKLALGAWLEPPGSRTSVFFGRHRLHAHVGEDVVGRLLDRARGSLERPCDHSIVPVAKTSAPLGALYLTALTVFGWPGGGPCGAQAALVQEPVGFGAAAGDRGRVRA